MARDIVFEKEFISLPTVEIENNQAPNIQEPPIQNEELAHVHEKLPQQSQEQVPLRKSIRERRSTILDDYVVYLQEHEFDVGLESDPISFSQAKQSSNSHSGLRLWRMR